MMPGGARRKSGMHRLLLSALHGLSLILQGGATGALAASIVLLRCRRRRRHVEASVVTAAWSALGAALALIGLVVWLLS